MAYRDLKKQALNLLLSENQVAALDTLCQLPPRQIVNPLIGLLCHGEPLVRWRAVTAMGAVVSGLAVTEIEAARIVMRRLMWMLNDESGGIGWGAPESLGEIMVRHERLASEFSCILVSYGDPERNYLEHPTLQQGVLWAWGRLGRARQELIQPGACLLVPFLCSEDPYLRGLAAWAAKPLKMTILQEPLKTLVSDQHDVIIYTDGQFRTLSIGHLAQKALSAMSP